MNVKIISENTYADTFERIIAIMRARKVDLSVRHILFVPDKYTLAAERLLYRGTAGAFDAEVLTLNRLFFRLTAGADSAFGSYLSKTGAVMLLRKIVARAADDLKCFNRCAGFRGFAEKLYDTIAQMQSSRVSADDLPQCEGALGRKLDDIRLIYGMYEKETRALFIDAGGRQELLLKALKDTRFFDGTVCYFANFDTPTAQARQIIDDICGLTQQAYIGSPTLTAVAVGKLGIYEAADSADEIKATARRIRNLAFKGVSYGDMCVVNASATGSAVRRIFGEFGIPCYVEEQHKLTAHPLCGYLRLLFETASLDRKAVIALSKNPYCGTLKPSRDIFESYCNKYCVDYLGFSRPFIKGYIDNPVTADEIKENAAVQTAEGVRAQLYKEMQICADGFKNVNNAARFASLIDVLIPHGESLVTQSLIGSGGDWGDVSDKIKAAAQVLVSVYGENFTSRDELLTAFFEGLESSNVSLLPNLGNSVTVAAADAFRGGKFQAIFIIGFDDNFPAAKSDGGIISDNEIERLKSSSVNLEPKIADINERALLEVRSLLSSCDTLYVSYAPPSNPSVLLNYAQKHAVSITKSNPVLERSIVRERQEDDFAAAYASCKSAALELLCLGVGERLKGGNGTGIESELHEALGSGGYKFLPTERKNGGVLTDTSGLFFGGGSTTISRIQEYFSCPYKHFLKYGLGLKLREDGELNPLDIGNFLHKVIEIFVSRGEFDDIARSIQIIVEETAEREIKYRLEANDGLIRQIEREATQIAAIVAAQIRGGSFKSLGTEMRFDARKNQLKTLCFDAGGSEISLSGIIDRADVFGDYARVIDYKTGHVKFAMSDLYFGLKIQIMLYMRVMQENGYKPAGMFYFPFSARWSDDAYSHRLLGVFNNDSEIARAMDWTLSAPSAVSVVINARTTTKTDSSGAAVLDKRSAGYTEEQLRAMSQYAFDVLKSGAKEIAEGNITPSPIKSDRCVCEFCDVRTVCGYDCKMNQVRKQSKVVAEDIILAGGRDESNKIY